MLLEKLQKNLELLKKKNLFLDKDIIIFGANAPATVTIDFLERHNIQVKAVIDNNTLLHGKNFFDIIINSPEKILEKFKSRALILIASRYYEEMKQQVEKMGYEGDLHILQTLDLSENVSYDTSLEKFDEMSKGVNEGLAVFERIQAKYNNPTIVMAPVRPNGDVYMISSYLPSYIQENKKSSKNDVILTVIGDSCEAVAKLFDIEFVEKLTIDESNNLAAYAAFLPQKIKVVGPYASHLELYPNMDGYKGLNFVDEVKYGLLGLKEKNSNVFPRNEYRKTVVKKIFEKYELEESNTVILAPYSNSIPRIKFDTWEKIANILKDKGYVVCTNCGTPFEQPIKGTKAVNFSFRDAVAVTESAGYLIAYRSGFCDIIANSKCKKVIVYPHHFAGTISLKEFYGMKGELYRPENLIEVEHNFATTEELVAEIIKNF